MSQASSEISQHQREPAVLHGFQGNRKRKTLNIVKRRVSLLGKQVSPEAENEHFQLLPSPPHPLLLPWLTRLAHPHASASPPAQQAVSLEEPGCSHAFLGLHFPQIRCLSHCCSNGVGTKWDPAGKSWRLSPNACSFINKPPILPELPFTIQENQLKRTWKIPPSYTWGKPSGWRYY